MAELRRKLFVGCDHAGFALKTHLISYIKTLHPEIQLEDFGTHSDASVDYPDFANKVTAKISAEEIGQKLCFGLLICGSGQGMAIAANKVKGIRAALCWNPQIAELARKHNDANVLCLGSRVIDFQTAELTLESFLKFDFEGDRHLKRLKKML